jgi:hypothetical protein
MLSLFNQCIDFQFNLDFKFSRVLDGVSAMAAANSKLANNACLSKLWRCICAKR